MLYESSYYGVCDLGGSLYHHGIKGQKWGVKNGPPYPLGASQKSKSEKSASSSKRRGTAKADNGRSRQGTSASVKTLNSRRTKQAGLIDPVTDTILAYTAITVALVAYSNHALKKAVKKEKEENMANTGDIKKKIKGNHSADQDMKAVNPGYKAQKPGSFMNCTMCTATYEMRRRGYDVEAQPSKLGRRIEDYSKWYNIKEDDISTSHKYNDVIKALQEQPNGSRGNITSGVGQFDSLHSMVWEKQNGKVIIRDAQSGIKYDNFYDSIIREDSSHPYQWYRTDNAEINWDLIGDAVRERRK